MEALPLHYTHLTCISSRGGARANHAEMAIAQQSTGETPLVKRSRQQSAANMLRHDVADTLVACIFCIMACCFCPFNFAQGIIVCSHLAKEEAATCCFNALSGGHVSAFLLLAPVTAAVRSLTKGILAISTLTQCKQYFSTTVSRTHSPIPPCNLRLICGAAHSANVPTAYSFTRLLPRNIIHRHHSRCLYKALVTEPINLHKLRMWCHSAGDGLILGISRPLPACSRPVARSYFC
jgi:hypothetical protein